MASERFIQFVWKNRLYSEKSLKTACGTNLEIINQGEHNFHAGPDFFNARIRMGHIVWAGNVEIHGRASDWYRHGHHLDPCYNNVILHVVGVYDTDVTNSLGRRIHTLVPGYHANLINRYDVLKKSESWLPCSGYIKYVSSAELDQWLSTLLSERISQKCRRIEPSLFDPIMSKEKVLYRALAAGYGIPVNKMPFELLAKGVSLDYLMDYRTSRTDLEAILFGHSGMLYSARNLGPYPSGLWNRYLKLHSHQTEKPVPRYLWRFFRLRPASFPTIRISQFASLLHHGFPLADRILETDSVAELEQILRTGASEYWDTHYLFGKCSPPFQKFPGEEFIKTLIINAIVPFLYATDKYHKRSDAAGRARRILQQLKAEKNQIIRNWHSFGIRAASAQESQALIQLYNVYCKNRLCLECRIGAGIVEAAGHQMT
jgi:hypothetical protein